MPKPNKPKKKELTLRVVPEIRRRLKWIELKRDDLGSLNEGLKEALMEWIEKMEKRYGREPGSRNSDSEKGGAA